MFFTGRMPFLPPNQHRQSTEGSRVHDIGESVNVCTEKHDLVNGPSHCGHAKKLGFSGFIISVAMDHVRFILMADLVFLLYLFLLWVRKCASQWFCLLLTSGPSAQEGNEAYCLINEPEGGILPETTTLDDISKFCMKFLSFDAQENH